MTAAPADIRRALGLSQAAFARALGVSPRTVQSWEQGRRHPDRWAQGRLEEMATKAENGRKP
jgi:putative transcriptional regulator